MTGVSEYSRFSRPPRSRALIIVFSLVLAFLYQPNGSAGKDLASGGLYQSVDGMMLVSHGGGGLASGVTSDSLEALETAYHNGHRIFELDFNWTRDGRLVVIHDWEHMFPVWFIQTTVKAPTHSEFMSLRMRHGLTQLDLPGLIDWMKRRTDAILVTDVKADNVKALSVIAAEAGILKERIIPQIYFAEEYEAVKRLGFRSIIFTLYRNNMSDEEVVRFAAGHSLMAVTMHFTRAVSTTLVTRLQQKKIKVFVHTVNSTDMAQTLRRAGVSGLYSDFLIPGKDARNGNHFSRNGNGVPDRF